MAEYINRETLRKILENWRDAHEQQADWEQFRGMVNAQPTASGTEDVIYCQHCCYSMMATVIVEVDDMKEGWICPRCGKVNAPFIGSCDCKPDKVVSNAGGECSCGGKHEWIIDSGNGNAYGAGVAFRCKKCGVCKHEWRPSNFDANSRIVINEF